MPSLTTYEKRSNLANMAIPAQIKTNLSRALFLLRLLLVVFGLMASTAVVRATTVAAPAFSPAAGTFTNAQTVTISSTTSGASIRYTTSGTAPTSTSGTVYSSPVSIGATAKLWSEPFKMIFRRMPTYVLHKMKLSTHWQNLQGERLTK